MKELARLQIDTAKIHTAGHAHQLLTKLEQRDKLGLCTPKQMHFLEKIGQKDVALLTKRDFTRIIMQKKRNSWRNPTNTQKPTPRPAAHANTTDSLPLH